MNYIALGRRRILAGAGLAFTAALVLTGCANPIESMIESASTSAADSLVSELTGVEVEGLGTGDIPADFPQSVPLPDATPHSALSHTNEGKKIWSLNYKEGANDQVFDDFKAAVVASGFTEDTSSDMLGAMRLAVYTNGELTVNISLLGPPEDEQIMQVLVTEG